MPFVPPFGVPRVFAPLPPSEEPGAAPVVPGAPPPPVDSLEPARPPTGAGGTSPGTLGALAPPPVVGAGGRTSLAVPGGRILQAGDLSAAGEDAIVAANGGRGVLMPYGRFDPAAEPVILVHGRHSSPDELQRLIARYADDPGVQVYVFMYDDSRELRASGEDLARSLEELRARHLTDSSPDVRIIAHSQGGILVRAALNDLTQPGWATEGAARRAGDGTSPPIGSVGSFGRIDVLTLDTPWHGFTPGGMSLDVMPFIPGGDLTADSLLMQELTGVPVAPNVSFNLVEAEAGAGDRAGPTHGVRELSDDEVSQLIAYFQDGTRPAGALWNYIRALAADEGYAAAQRDLTTRARAGTLTTAYLRERLAEIVPSVRGEHGGLDNPRSILRSSQLDLVIDDWESTHPLP